MNADAAGFYDDLADDYHLIFVDWDRTIAYQAGVLVPLLRGLGVPDGGRVLDASCGIGTQALGLAAAGYVVTGTDLSPGAIERARVEATARGLDARFAVADLRRLAEDVGEQFDCVLSCDNSLAHMLEDDDLAAAAAGLAACTTPGGVAFASIRPYDELAAERPTTTLPRIGGTPDARTASFQIWDWDEAGRTYGMEQLVLREGPRGTWTARTHVTRLRAVRRQELLDAFTAAGLQQVRWLTAEESGYYQPIAAGRKA